MKPISRDAYDLLHQGQLLFSKIEQNGIAVDGKHLEKARKEITIRRTELAKELDGFPEIKLWKRVYGEDFNLDAGDQLARILYEELGKKAKKFTKRNNPSVDQDALEGLNIPFVRVLIQWRKMNKLLGTYIAVLERETVDGMVHPSFGLHLVQTYRSSSSGPNFQNNPTRDEEMARYIRLALGPRSRSRQIGEGDCKGIEVAISCCYHHDPVLIRYVCDKTLDMHRDVAMLVYKLRKEQMTKPIRYCGKNKFVFPEFYGSYYVPCAIALWEAIDRMDLETADGQPLREHLRDHGISKYQQFEDHVRDVEDDFWNTKFKVYTAWKDQWFKQYLRRGYVDLLTGFRCSGVMRRNQVINYPIQGTAFHCLLKGLINQDRQMVRDRMESLIIGQIHDSGIFDLVPEEAYPVLSGFRHQIQSLHKTWSWINVPLEVEAELAPPGASWFDKKEIKWKE